MSKKENFTAGLVAKKQCEPGKTQSIFSDGKTPGLGLRVTAAGAKSYIFETRLHGKTLRMTIGDVRTWPVGKAQAEATTLKAMTDKGIDPRQVIADAVAAKEAEAAAKRAEAAAREDMEARESVTVAEAWQAYIAERSASIKDGKPEWGERHKAHHAYFVQPGGEKRTRGRRPNEPATTRPGILVPLMTLRLADLDENAVQAWFKKEVAQAPTSAAKAFRFLRAFLTWCGQKDAYSAAVHSDACETADIKKLVPSPKTKPNDSLRRAQIKPWFEYVRKIKNPVISAYLQGLLLTGARRNELATLRWRDVDFQWKSLTIRDKVEGERTIPLTPYLESLIAVLPRRNLTAKQIGDTPDKAKKDVPNEFVFSSPTSKSGRLEEPRNLHNKALVAAALPPLSLHGLRRSFGTLSEWVEVPAGIVAQIMGHKPSAIAEKHYVQRELDLLHLWHVKIEKWILDQAGIEQPKAGQSGLPVVA